MRRTPLLILLVVVAFASAAWAGEKFPVQVIELSGTPAEIGHAHGKQLAKPINALSDNYVKRFFGNDRQREMAMRAAAVFETKLDPRHLEEIKALAEASGVSTHQAMLGNCFLDLTPITACSAVALTGSASADGVPRLARNLDFPSLGVLDGQSVLLIYRPRDRFAFAAVSWPGMAGVVSGMNEHGLTLANMEVDRPGGVPKAMPYALLYRTILEKCKTVKEAIDLLEKADRQTPNNLILMDADGGRAVVEIYPDKIVVRRAENDKPLISTNHRRDKDNITPGQCRRYDRLLAGSQRDWGRLEQKSIEKMLAEVAQGKMTLQSMVFEPSNRVIHLSAGANAPTKPFASLDLKPYFQKKD